MRKRTKLRKKRKIPLDRPSRKRGPRQGQSSRGKTSVASLAGHRLQTVEYDSPFVATDPLAETGAPEKKKKGPKTLPDDFLVGSRNYWLYFFEEAWPEIGWSLISIRKTRSGTIEDIQKIFEPVQSKDNCSHGRAFLRGSPQAARARELRRNRIKAYDFHRRIQEMQSRCIDLKGSCTEAEGALKLASGQEAAIVSDEYTRNKRRLHELQRVIEQTGREVRELDKTLLDQETYLYCSELLKFLIGKKQYAVDPINLANALAGLPEMEWRESHARCSKMPRSSALRLPYRAFEVVERIWRRRPKDRKGPPNEFFRDQIIRLPRHDDGIRATLCRTWRDLQLALEKCCTEQHSEEFMPYAITSAYIRNFGRNKTLLDQTLDRNAMLLKESTRG